MGDIIDLENIENIPRCTHAKLLVIIFNLIGAPSSFIILIISILIMIHNKKRITFLTSIILFIFFFEIMNSFSKLLQLLKYAFEDTRPIEQKNEIETPRGRICQIQIVTSIFSDFGCLLGTLLLSARCYDIIKNRKRCSDSKKIKFLSFFCITAISIIFAIGFLLIDRYKTSQIISFKYDLRDRCNYWCWLEHDLSSICYGFYVLIIIFIGIYFYLTIKYLNKSYQNILEKSIVLIGNSEGTNINNKENINSKEVIQEKQYMSKEDKDRLDELRIMKIKCVIYPSVTLIIWFLSLIYRIIDDFVLKDIDKSPDSAMDEKKIFDEYPGLQGFVESNLIFHTILSAFRGTLYGFAFIIFEEKAFGDIFRRFYRCCFKKLNIYDLDDDEQNNDDKINSSSSSSMTDMNGKDSNEENQFRKSSGSDYGRHTADLNTSDYRYND